MFSIHKSIANSNSMTPLAPLLHVPPTLTYCNPIQTSSSSSRLMLSDDCMCNPVITLRLDGGEEIATSYYHIR